MKTYAATATVRAHWWRHFGRFFVCLTCRRLIRVRLSRSPLPPLHAMLSRKFSFACDKSSRASFLAVLHCSRWNDVHMLIRYTGSTPLKALKVMGCMVVLFSAALSHTKKPSLRRDKLPLAPCARGPKSLA